MGYFLKIDFLLMVLVDVLGINMMYWKVELGCWVMVMYYEDVDVDMVYVCVMWYWQYMMLESVVFCQVNNLMFLLYKDFCYERQVGFYYWFVQDLCYVGLLGEVCKFFFDFMLLKEGVNCMWVDFVYCVCLYVD